MAHLNKVVRSVNAPGEQRCVDVFCRPDGSFGFEEYRRDPEDGQGWYPTGYFGHLAFQDAEAAWHAACAQVTWLTGS